MSKWLVFTLCLWLVAALSPVQATDSPWDAAADYSRRNRGEAFLVFEDGEIVYESYDNGYTAETPHVLYSGTKSFSCVMAVKAVEQGLITWEERLSDTLTEWQADDPLRDITVRQALSLTSGLPAEDSLSTRRIRDKLAVTLSLAPIYGAGDRFVYGAPNFYAFAEVLARKLPDGDALSYLKREILDPIGLTDWTLERDAVGTPNFASGMQTTAREWLKFGQLILNGGAWDGQQILDADALKTCFIGTTANPYYGLTWWLAYDITEMPSHLEDFAKNVPDPSDFTESIVLGETQPTVWIAAGAFDQRMYIFPNENRIVVRLSRESRRFDDKTMLRLLDVR